MNKKTFWYVPTTREIYASQEEAVAEVKSRLLNSPFSCKLLAMEFETDKCIFNSFGFCCNPAVAYLGSVAYHIDLNDDKEDGTVMELEPVPVECDTDDLMYASTAYRVGTGEIMNYDDVKDPKVMFSGSVALYIPVRPLTIKDFSGIKCRMPDCMGMPAYWLNPD